MEDTKDSEFHDISQTNYNKLTSAMTKAGYSDGISEGRDAVFQQGFDVGYSDGLRTAFEIAKWKAIRNCLNGNETAPKIIDNHPVLDSPERNHHKFLGSSKLSVEDTSRRQNDYLHEITQCFDRDFKQIKEYLE